MGHPSNTLYRGECTNLDEAFDLVINEIEYEVRTWPNDAPEDEQKFITEFKEDIKQVQALKSEYLSRINAVREELMLSWQSREGWANQFADAFFSGDYSGLAI